MSRLLIGLIAATMLMLVPASTLAAEQPGTTTWVASDQAPLVPVVDPVTDDGKTYSPEARRMSWRERRFRGLTPFNVMRVARELRKEGNLDLNDRDLAKFQIMGRIVKERPEAYPEPGEPGAPTEREWDDFFAFLEKLFEFLMEMFAAWGWMAI